MKKHAAIKTLAAELAIRGYVSIVNPANPVIKKMLEASAVVPVSDKGIYKPLRESAYAKIRSDSIYISPLKHHEEDDLDLGEVEQERTEENWVEFFQSELGSHYSAHRKVKTELAERCEDIMKQKAMHLGANYIVLDTVIRNFNDYEDYFSITMEGWPAAVIGIAEAEILREVFMGDPPQHIQKAADSLKIDLNIDFKSLFEEDRHKFKHYFSKVSDTKREAILKDLGAEVLATDDIGKWITEKFPKLSKKVARTMIKQ
jgi:hypothetical protein